ncbi:MAG: helix-turn-helix transcriptional regulator [Bacteroidota bacterium]
MKDRIKEFIDYKGISAGDLASLLEVQRSNISHILNGRNKPGAALIEKLLNVFPDLNARWLLTGEGLMLDTKQKFDNHLAKNADESQELPTVKASTRREVESEELDKILLLFNNGTFKTYKKSV